MRLCEVLSGATLAATALAETHYLFSGFFSGSTIVGLEFDPDAGTLTVAQNITTDAASGSKWIELDEAAKNLYVGTTGYFQSYSITDDLSLEYQSNVSLSANCSNANFIVSTTSDPYTVFGAPYSGGCASLAISVGESGMLEAAFANVTYDSAAGVHGLALSANNDFVYSADDMGNAVWAHSYDSATGTVEEIQYIAAPTGANPRHLIVHTNGLWVYVVYEELNQLAVYSRDNTTGLLTDTNTTYPLIPSSYTNTSSYWADEVKLSVPSDATASPKYLICGTRSRETSAPGYVSAFALDSESGAITEQLFLLPTTASGGSANAVSPAKFDEAYFAITDSGSNFIEIWKIEEGDASTTASAIAHLALANGPANAVWLS
ncbi:3-carboxy-cis,cis-mucoante lactonizing enzyme [Thozetella sp. PMI_491]|nr:3-carboxy-cis,cis-mucoante lactonizing enzyme [Thozetella sp. PMI_491]